MLIKYNNHLLLEYIDYDEYNIVKISFGQQNQYNNIISIDSITHSISIKLFINNLQSIIIHCAFDSNKFNFNYCFYIAKPDFSNGDEFINLREIGKYNNFRKFINGFINANQI